MNSSRTVSAVLAFVLGLCATTLQTFAADIQLISRTEVADLAFPSALATNGEGLSTSADGRFVLYRSNDPWSNQDLNDGDDVFLLDRETGEVRLVSHSLAGSDIPGDDDASDAAISADGSTVIFESNAQDLVSGFVDNNGNQNDLYAWDRDTGVIRLVSHVPGSETTSGNGALRRAEISGDGSAIAFASSSSDLIPGTDVNGSTDLFLWSRASGAVSLISRTAADPTITANGASFTPRISSDGAWVAFESVATDLIAGVDGNSNTDIFLWNAATGTVTLVSQAVAGPTTTGNSGSFSPRISDDGSTVAFSSVATDLVTGTDTNSRLDIFAWDRATGTTTLVSHTAADANITGNDESTSLRMSADGQTVVFESRATNLVAATDGNNNSDVFRWQAGTTTLISSPDSGVTTGNGRSSGPRLSNDGETVAFLSSATDLVTGTDPNGTSDDVFLWRQAIGNVEPASRSFADPNSTANRGSSRLALSADGNLVVFNSGADDLLDFDAGSGLYGLDVAADRVELLSRTRVGTVALAISPETAGSDPATSGDGRFVAFTSSDTTLISGLTNPAGNRQVFLWDRTTGAIALVSSSTAGSLVGCNRNADLPQVSGDGSTVVFQSQASDLVAGANPTNRQQIWAWERATGDLRLVSQVPGSTLGGNGSSSNPLVSTDGNTVVFASRATDLATGGEGNFGDDLFAWDASTGNVRVVSRTAADPTITGNGNSFAFSISTDGRYTAFESTASNLVVGFTSPPSLHVFLWDRDTGDLSLVSRSAVGATTGGNAGSSEPQISADGSAIAFSSDATDLVTGFSGGGRNVFLWQRATGTLQLVSHAAGAATTAGNGSSFDAAISGDGEVVAFESQATDLVAGLVDGNGTNDVFVWTRSPGSIELISNGIAGPNTTGNDRSINPLISRDGNRVVYESDATDLLPGFTTVEANLFLFDRTTGAIRLVNESPAGPTVGSMYNGTGNPAFAADGRSIVFEYFEMGLVDGLANDTETDVFQASFDDATEADLELTFAGIPGPLPPATSATLDATVRNLSPNAVSHVYLMLQVPLSGQLLGFSGTGWTCQQYLTTLSCSRGTLAGNDSSNLSVTLQTPAQLGPISFLGSTLSNGVDPDLANNPARLDTVVAPDDWGDAPESAGYPTLASSNGARHAWSPLFLGASIDVDLDGQPTPGADGDDADGVDDEDGVTFPSPLIQGQSDDLTVVASGNGLLDVWVDWNADGDWDDSGEKTIDGQPVVAGSNTLSLAAPLAATLGDTFARVRFSTAGAPSPTGAAADGEVEDYALRVEARTDLGITKSDGPDPVIAGESLTYTLAVTNGGPSPSTGATVTDLLPSGVSFLSSADGCFEAGGTVSCAIGALSPGNSQMVSFLVTVDPGQTATLSNIASVAGNEVDPVIANNNSPAATTAVEAVSDLVVTKTDGLAFANPGDLVTYTITVTKSGPSAAPGTRVTDTFPPALSAVTWTCSASVGSSCTATGAGDLDDLADLAAGGTVTYVATGTIDPSFVGMLENSATAAAAPSVTDPNGANNSATDITEVISPAEVSGTMEVLAPAAPGGGGRAFAPGDTVTYVVTLSNSGLADQLDNPGPELLDELPDGLNVLDASADFGVATIDQQSNSASWNGVIPAGGLVVVEIDATLDNGAVGATLLNQGRIFFDADGDGINEVEVLTDDPNVSGAGDPTSIQVASLLEIPTLGHLGLLLMSLALGLLGLRRLRSPASCSPTQRAK